MVEAVGTEQERHHYSPPFPHHHQGSRWSRPKGDVKQDGRREKLREAERKYREEGVGKTTRAPGGGNKHMGHEGRPRRPGHNDHWLERLPPLPPPPTTSLSTQATLTGTLCYRREGYRGVGREGSDETEVNGR